MIRHVITVVSALALMSGVALAQTEVEGSKSVTITRSAPHEMGGSRVIVKRHINHRGMIVTKKRSFRDGFYGGSMSRTRTVTDPMTGETRSRKVIER